MNDKRKKKRNPSDKKKRSVHYQLFSVGAKKLYNFPL
jgi:hypothetical protein